MESTGTKHVKNMKGGVEGTMKEKGRKRNEKREIENAKRIMYMKRWKGQSSKKGYVKSKYQSIA